jgi:hypothetical protein
MYSEPIFETPFSDRGRMLTTDEIQMTQTENKPLDHLGHPCEVPPLTMRGTFFPYGFPVELRTNSAEILAQANAIWSIFPNRFDREPIRVDVHVLPIERDECPPAPVPHIVGSLVVNVADHEHFSIADLDRGTTQVVITRGAEKFPRYLDYFLLGAAPLCHFANRHATAIHAACVARNGRGVLLCGESGAGKSSLAYACARSGWSYITDDASYMLNDRSDPNDRLVTGNCHSIRFRPSAQELFPEIAGHELTPRAAGKPSIELPTAPMTWITCEPSAQVDFVVFLNRRATEEDALVPYSRDVARRFMREVQFGPQHFRDVQYASIERMLTAEVFELRYRDLGWAIDRLDKLTQEGR